MGLFWSSHIMFFLFFLFFCFHFHHSFSSPTSDLFNSWCVQHGKTYSSEEEKLYRLTVFEDNLAYVTQNNNLENSSYTLDLNAFADLTHHEFKASELGLRNAAALTFRDSRSHSSKLTEELSIVRDVPSAVDWRKKGVVTPVKDQASFDLVDMAESDEEKLLQAVASQPVSVGLCGSERSFQLYSKGIFNGPCSKTLDHVVLIVGYGSENGVDYWILKNSWGKNWGMDGYMYMLRNSGDREGVCGINMIVKTSPNPLPSSSATVCSLFKSCEAEETCCCTFQPLFICYNWKCCDLPSAVCCKDGSFCCPKDYPICDTKTKQCSKRTNSSMVKGIEMKGSIARTGGRNALMEAFYM